MSKRIWKYELEITDTQTLVIPSACYPSVLSAKEQGGSLCVWIQIDDYKFGSESNQATLVFQIIGTGAVEPYYLGRFVDTVQMTNGLVWHVFVQGDMG